VFSLCGRLNEQGQVVNRVCFSWDPSVGLQMHPFPVSSHDFPLYVCGLISSCKDTGHVGLVPILKASLLTELPLQRLSPNTIAFWSAGEKDFNVGICGRYRFSSEQWLTYLCTVLGRLLTKGFTMFIKSWNIKEIWYGSVEKCCALLFPSWSSSKMTHVKQGSG
jgi:hypothetical protein